MEMNITSRTVTDEAGNTRKYHYTLLVDVIEAGRFVCEDYGVQVWEEDGDCVRIPSITTSAMRIDELISRLVEHSVSPTTLPDVVVDWM